MPLRQKFFLIAGLSTLIYLLVFSLPYPLSQHYNTIPPVDYAKLSLFGCRVYLTIVGLALIRPHLKRCADHP
jgi:hypothetical protein